MIIKKINRPTSTGIKSGYAVWIESSKEFAAMANTLDQAIKDALWVEQSLNKIGLSLNNTNLTQASC